MRRAVAWQGARRDHWSGILDGSNEAIASAGKRLDVARAFGRVAQSVAQPLDGCVEADIEVHESVRGPKLLAQFFSRDHLTRTLQQQGQDLKGLSGTPTTADQFSFTAQVQDSAATPQTATRSYTVTIAPASHVIVSTASLNFGRQRRTDHNPEQQQRRHPEHQQYRHNRRLCPDEHLRDLIGPQLELHHQRNLHTHNHRDPDGDAFDH
ncbi:MAG TPA: hypothetical protein VKE24_16210 [Candidatus Acidoferrales bacterium]|nr:hypothetical protein [Candidatus Acidoferrales bacterium]